MATRRYVEFTFNKEFNKFFYLLDEESYKNEEYRKIAFQVGWVRALKRYIKIRIWDSLLKVIIVEVL